MVPGQPVPVSARRAVSITTVQRWVMSTLVATTGLHLAAGLVVAAHYVDPQSSKIGLLVIGLLLGVLTMAGALMIHRTRVLHPLLLLGALPAVAGAFWVLG